MQCECKKLFCWGKSIIGKVAVILVESLEDGAGPQIDKALSESEYILQEIWLRNFQQRQSRAEQEFQEAISLLGKMKEEALPVRDNNLLLVDCPMTWPTGLTELTKNKVNLGGKLRKTNRSSSSLGSADDIQQRYPLRSTSGERTAILESTRKTLD